MRTVEIPGGVARFRDRSEIRGRDSKLVKAATLAAANVLAKLPEEATIKPGETEQEAANRLQEVLKDMKLELTMAEAQKLLDLKETIVIAYLASWTLELPLPTLETIGDLPENIYDALDAAVGGEVVNVATSGVNFDVNPDQNSPTGPSLGSGSELRAEQDRTDSPATPTSTNGIDPSAGESSSEPLKSSTTRPEY